MKFKYIGKRELFAWYIDGAVNEGDVIDTDNKKTIKVLESRDYFEKVSKKKAKEEKKEETEPLDTIPDNQENA